MPHILSNTELQSALHMEYSQQVLMESKERRRKNINTFLNIDRGGLVYGETENRLCLYESLENEKIYIQYPGKESAKQQMFPKDFRPKLQMSDGTMMEDASFGFIWDIFDNIGKKHKGYLNYVASILIHMQYLYNYQLCREEYECQKVAIKDDDLKISEKPVILEWYKLNISEDVWYTLNDRFGMIDVPNGSISFEAFIKFIDLLFQNEDCKYYYKSEVLEGDKFDWNKTGRPNTVSTNLRILRYLEDKEKLSDLLNGIQKGRGVMSFKKADYSVVTDDIVINIEIKK